MGGAGQLLVAALARAGGGIELVRVPSWAPLFESLPITAEPLVLLADADARDAAAAHADAPSTPRALLSPSNSFRHGGRKRDPARWVACVCVSASLRAWAVACGWVCL